MATRFTFAGGNLSKLARLPLYVLARPVQWLTPRSRREWVFGSGAGLSQGAWELWQEVAAREPDARLTWLVANEAQAEQAVDAGVEFVAKDSWAGFWRTLRAGTVVVTHGLGDVNRYGSGGAFLVQLWHGIPLKRIHLDSPATFALGGRLPAAAGRILRGMYRLSTRAISLFPVPSQLVGSRIASAFGLDPARIAVTGDPRDEALVAGTPASRRAASLRVLLGAGVLSGEERERRLVLFAPTWRDGEEDPTVPTEAERDALEALAQRLDALILFRPHPLGLGAYRRAIAGAPRLRMVSSEAVPDVNAVLSAVDALVTDYSSVALDYSLAGGHIVWFAPDRASYEKSRGLYEDYEATTGGHEETWAGVIAQLEARLSGGPEAAASLAATEALRDRFFEVRTPGAPGRVYEQVLARRDGGAAAASAGLPSVSLAEVPADPATGTGPTVFFESFYGRRANDNPAGIDAALAALRPDVRRVWSVANDTVTVPEGAVAVLEGSPAWARERAAASTLVVNDWLRTPVADRRRQKVLQTWHGTPLKRLALGRPKVGLRTRLAILRQTRRWDALLSQSPFCSAALAGDYAYRGPVWETGYPRNDAMVLGTRADARAALGLPGSGRVVLYAPTWRDDGRVVLDGAGLAALAASLGEGTTLLVRAHSRVTEGFEGAPGVLEVSDHEDLGELLRAADALVTDYSSMMFDAAAISLPLAFFVPDLELYRDEQRGFSFDFEAEAPGPVVREASALPAAIAGLWERPGAFAGAYAAWRERYTPWDDGGAGARVVERLEAEGFLPPAT
ncbi:CDP-glycerol glycerophosphotransferase family protein [Galactobacter valiniphilus]|uniref:CDP-glycerol glycerophosphotransferase family protein n=1 Tax=Galactobacter valiniphilus TaxID=2676122 RepID=UPI00373645A8